MQANTILKYISLKKIVVPIVIGLGFVCYMLFKKIDVNTFKNLTITPSTWVWVFIALLMLAVRDIAYMIRLRILSKQKLNWRQCFDVVFCWEFASAVAPGAVGGGFAFAIFALTKEGLTVGKSAAIVLFTSLLDGLFFILLIPFFYFLIGKESLFYNVNTNVAQVITNNEGLHTIMWTIYGLLILYKLIIAFALFINAKSIKYVLIKLFSLPILKKWRTQAAASGDELIIAAKELKNESKRYYLYGLLSTFASWTARFTIVNCIIAAFSTISFSHLLLFGRQLIVGVLMIGTPTPGGAGLAELSFQNFYGEFTDSVGLTITLALLWRLLSYYPYLIMGAIVIPRWIKRVF